MYFLEAKISTSHTVAKRDFRKVLYSYRKAHISAAPAQRQQQRAGNRTSKQALVPEVPLGGLLGASQRSPGCHLGLQNVLFYTRFTSIFASGHKNKHRVCSSTPPRRFERSSAFPAEKLLPLGESYPSTKQASKAKQSKAKQSKHRVCSFGCFKLRPT